MSISSLEKILKALSDRNRLRVVALLSEREMCVCELASILGITQPSVSKHLKKLRQAGIILARQSGLWTNYRLSREQPVGKSVIKLVAEFLKADQDIKADLRKAKKVDRNELC